MSRNKVYICLLIPAFEQMGQFAGCRLSRLNLQVEFAGQICRSKFAGQICRLKNNK